MDVEVIDDDEFMRHLSSERKERIKVLKKMETDLERVDEEGGW